MQSGNSPDEGALLSLKAVSRVTWRQAKTHRRERLVHTVRKKTPYESIHATHPAVYIGLDIPNRTIFWAATSQRTWLLEKVFDTQISQHSESKRWRRNPAPLARSRYASSLPPILKIEI